MNYPAYVPLRPMPFQCLCATLELKESFEKQMKDARTSASVLRHQITQNASEKAHLTSKIKKLEAELAATQEVNKQMSQLPSKIKVLEQEVEAARSEAMAAAVKAGGTTTLASPRRRNGPPKMPPPPNAERASAGLRRSGGEAKAGLNASVTSAFPLVGGATVGESHSLSADEQHDQKAHDAFFKGTCQDLLVELAIVHVCALV